MWPMIGLYQSAMYSAPSGPVARAVGRKLGSFEETRSGSDSPHKPEPSSLTLTRYTPWKLITFMLRKLPQNASGKCRLVRMCVPGLGRDGRSQKIFIDLCLAG